MSITQAREILKHRFGDEYSYTEIRAVKAML